MSIFLRAKEGLGRMWNAPLRRREARAAAWKAVAARFGGRYAPEERTFWKWKSATLEVPVGDALVFVDVDRRQVGNAQVLLARYRATFLLSVGPTFKVVPSNATAKLATALGFDDAVLGDERFDRAFTVRTSDVEATRRAWKPRALELAHALPKAITLSANAERVTLFDARITHEERELEAAIEVVGTLASYGSELLDALRQVRDAKFHPAKGPWDERTTPNASLVLRDAKVFLHPAVVELKVVARATVKLDRDVESFELAVDENGHATPDPPEGVLGPMSGPLLAQLGAAFVSNDGRHVRVTLFEQHTPTRLRQAAELAIALALGEPSEGLFR